MACVIRLCVGLALAGCVVGAFGICDNDDPNSATDFCKFFNSLSQKEKDTFFESFNDYNWISDSMVKRKPNFIRFGKLLEGDKPNFIRFGKRSIDRTPRQGPVFMRVGKSSSNPNFMRFGRSGASPNFMRFGRSSSPNFMRFGRSGTPNFMRFGRSIPYSMRFGRSETPNFMRFGRSGTPNFMRFGRDTPNFMRFGKRVIFCSDFLLHAAFVNC